MKTFGFFAFAAAALSLAFTGCKENEPVAPGQVIQRGDQACRIELFVLNLTDDTELKADAYDYDRTIDIAYNNANAAFLDGATATYTLSEGATIAPDPASAMDYTQPIEFTVTAPDGVTKRVYTTRPMEAVVETYIKASEFVERSTGDLAISNKTPAVGISGTDVVVGTSVFNAKTLAPVGSLNVAVPELDGKVLAWSGNDEAGHFVGVFNADGANGTGPCTIAIWVNGWAQAPKIQANNSGATWARYMHVAGNVVSGKGFITSQGASGATGTNNVLTLTDGAHDYTQINTGKASNDGNWGQTIAPASGDAAGTWFCWDSDAGTTNIYHGTGWSAESTPSLSLLSGSAANGTNLWGNYTLGYVKAFTFNDTAYALTMTTGWPCTYVSVVDTENNFVLNSANLNATMNYAAPEYQPTGTFIFDEEDNCGYVYVYIPGYTLKVWKLEVAVL